MAKIPVTFTYHTGIKRSFIKNARLMGSWDNSGIYSDNWTTVPMSEEMGEDGCQSFRATTELDSSQVGREFRWGVSIDTQTDEIHWGIATEINDHQSIERYRSFQLNSSPHEQRYYLTHSRRLGAQKYFKPGETSPRIRFSVWAPNAENVEVVFGEFINGERETGYIADDGHGIDQSIGNNGSLPMVRVEDGIWETEELDILKDFSIFDHKPYMFRITKEGGQVAYRSDIYSRCQIGKGKIDPQGGHYNGSYRDLDGTVSCSVVIDPEKVSKNFEESVWPEIEFISQEEFWKDEFNSNRPLPKRLEDLVIYELHVGSLAYGEARAGNFKDTIDSLDYFVELGINAIELLPVLEFEGSEEWGYGTSHFFAFEYSAGGRDQLKHLVRACHQRGIAVIMDIVFNHYHHNAERAEWTYDSDIPEHNIYYWYEGNSSDYPNANPPGHGGYVDNESTGYAPRFYEEMVRKLFISSGTTLIEEFHIDGFRVDQTTSIHSYNRLHADGRAVPNANIFGAKFLREWTRTVKLVKPNVFLVAEDHSEWDKVVESSEGDGLGFDAVWYANFYHHLIGDGNHGDSYAKLLRNAGVGDNQPLAMDYFAGALSYSGNRKVVYHESHDEAGNAQNSQRTIVTAVNAAPLFDQTRFYAEARSKFAAGMSMLSAGVPMFFMAEEIGAQKPFRYDRFIEAKEDLNTERNGTGRTLFKFYQDLIRFRLDHSALRSYQIDVLYVHNANRIIAFRRWNEQEELLIIGSLNNYPFSYGYTIRTEPYRLSDGLWKELFNSDSQIYGGNNIGNLGLTLQSINGLFSAVLPANGFVVFQKIS
jgi:1,4-alpha-glucan branching enzyme